MYQPRDLAAERLRLCGDSVADAWCLHLMEFLSVFSAIFN